MKYTDSLRAIVFLALLGSLLPSASAGAVAPAALPPSDMFQLPWDQGASWVAIDGLDNGAGRPSNSSHNYLLGGAVDFAPHNDMKVGENTSNDWVTAAAAGTVTVVSASCRVKIDHGNGWSTEYQYIGNIQVKVGDSVARNQRLGVVADGVRLKFCPPVGDPDVPHLHFMLRANLRNAALSGWTVNFNSVSNLTTFTKGAQALGLFKPLLNAPSLRIALRDPITFDTVYNGSVDAFLYEKWPFVLTGSGDFTLTATPTATGLTPLLVLLDANGNELTHSTGTLTGNRPAGNYFVQVQPQAGSGLYQLLGHQQGVTTGSSVSTVLNPASLQLGETAAASVNLSGVPLDGYTSAEFTCTYNASIAGVSNIVAGALFGADAVVAINGPQNGSFIVAIAGSNGNKATTDGPAFTFNVNALQMGQTSVACTARVSKGDSVLSSIPSTPASLTILDNTPTPMPTDPVVPTATPTLSLTVTPGPSATPMLTPTPTLTPTATALPAGQGMVSGKALAGKPVGLNLFGAGNVSVATMTANPDGTFSLTAPAGTYTMVVTAPGFLSASGAVTLASGGAGTLPTINLIAGDIDNNNVIDQFDAMTLGMNYNLAVPAAADLNNDGIINVLDLELLAHNYRKTGPTTLP